MIDAGKRDTEKTPAPGSWGVVGFFALSGAALTVFPGIDLYVSGRFFDPQRLFYMKDALFCTVLYRLVEIFAWTLAAGLPGLWMWISLGGKTIFSLGRRALCYLLMVLVMGPGLVVNVVFKDHWGRARPNQIEAFGGEKRFTPAWVLSTECTDNCAFVSGHASMGFYLFAFAFVAPKHRRKWTALGTATGLGVGLVRMIQGSHFLSDVICSGMMVYLVAWGLSRFTVFYDGAVLPRHSRSPGR